MAFVGHELHPRLSVAQARFQDGVLAYVLRPPAVGAVVVTMRAESATSTMPGLDFLLTQPGTQGLTEVTIGGCSSMVEPHPPL